MLVKLTGVNRQVIISSCLYLGQILTGYTASWPGPILPKFRDLDQSPLPYLLTEAQLSLVASIIFIGGVLGPYIILWLSNTRGRKFCIICAGILAAIGYIILATANNLVMVYIGRVLKGVAVNTLIILGAVYVGEIASTNIRGILLAALGILNTSGSLLMFCIGPFTSYHVVAYIGVALSILFVVLSIFIPESPIFYILQGKDNELRKVLQYLGRSEDVEKLLKMKNEITEVNTKKEWKELFTVRSNRKSLLITVGIFILQQFSGIFAIVFFSTTIFEMAGSSLSSDIAMIIIVCIQLAGCLITPFLIERIGRKIILLFSCAVCSLTMFLLGLYFYLDSIENPGMDNVRWLPLVLLVFFFLGFNFGLGPIPGVLLGEMFTESVRSKGSTVAMTSSGLAGFIVTTAFGSLLETVGGYVAFWVFTCTSALAFLFTVIFIPETRGKTLSEIQEMLSSIYLGQILTGFTASWPGPILPKFRDLDQSPLPYLLTETQLSLVASILFVGAVPGPYIILWLSNIRGRKFCIICAGILAAIGYIILATANNLAMVYIGRILKGVAVSTLSIASVVYMGEIASTNIRGILLTALELVFTSGSLLMFCVGPFTSYHIVAYIGVALSILFVVLLIFIPESPIFYILQGKDNEVRRVLQYLGRSEDIEKLLKTKNDYRENNTKKEWKELFTVRSNRKSLLITAGISIFQQFSGVLAIVFFSTTIFEMAGSSLSSDISMIIIVCIQLGGCLITPFIIERIGRKIILLFSCAVCSLTMFLLGLYFYLDSIGNPVIDSVRWLPLVLLVFFFLGYNCGLGAIASVLVGEMFTENARSNGTTLAMTSAGLTAFIVTTAFGSLLETVGGYVAFWVFTCTSALAFLFTLIFIPETRGKTLLEIQEMLS